MAKQKSGSDTADSQSAQLQDSDNPRVLNSEMAKAFQELAQGETTASALEAKLDGIEGRIDQLLASMEENLKQDPTAADSSQSK